MKCARMASAKVNRITTGIPKILAARLSMKILGTGAMLRPPEYGNAAPRAMLIIAKVAMSGGIRRTAEHRPFTSRSRRPPPARSNSTGTGNPLFRLNPTPRTDESAGPRQRRGRFRDQNHKCLTDVNNGDDCGGNSRFSMLIIEKNTGDAKPRTTLPTTISLSGLRL